ncbi:MAG: Uma2 family endonuclease [Chloroflexi bacterium]|nr:Uma2 family endonuclease [Chloroflexota bacterium]
MVTTSTTSRRATVDDLYRVPDNAKAEVVDGRVQVMAPAGFGPNRAAAAIYRSLYDHERRRGGGYAITDNAGFRVDLPNRKSFSPDAAFYTGRPTGMKFLEGAPVFAVEVRSEGDYGPAAEEALRAKRADYFQAGTLVVWDVDLLSEDVVRVYRASGPDHPTIYRRGEVAEAEPAVPGWRMPVEAFLMR